MRPELPMTLKYYFGTAVVATSALVASVTLGYVEDNAITLVSVALPLFLLGASAAWFLDALDRRLSELSRTATRLSANDPSVIAANTARDSVGQIARSLEGVENRMTELQARIDQQRAIVEHAPDAMWVYHVESGMLVDINQKFADLCGYSRDQMIGMTPAQLSAPFQGDGQQLEAFMASLIRRALDGERVVMPIKIITRAGVPADCELRAIRLPSLPGRTLVGGSMIDVGERLRGEQALAYRLSFEALISRLSTEMISLSSGSVDRGIRYALEEIGRFAQADRSYVFQFGEDGRTVSCTHEWCGDGIEPQHSRLQALSVDTFSWCVEHLRRGEVLHVPRVSELPAEARAEREEWQAEGIQSLLLVPMRTSLDVPGYVGFDWVRGEKRWPPELIFVLTIFGEMVSNLLSRQRVDSELEGQRAALEQSIGELTRSNSELQRFAYAASHDLQEPLRAISGFSDLLARRYKGKLDPTADEYLEFVREAVARMRSMIVNLLDYSRIESSPKPFERCDLNSIYRMALSNLHASIEELDAHLQCEPLPEVMGDASQLVQLLQNLIGNAIKFHGREQPQVAVTARLVNGEWRISVTDNGIGIEPGDTERVFEVFKRLHAADRYPGSGIGLSVCKRIIERHRGRIWAEPVGIGGGRGTTFHFTVPVLGGA
ncbi:ATP-binding protein [Hydrocarboniphaga effusa]|jgi:PAS domain S-box-containing protein|uniref:ATP-binding protein n=1 Tax=Hydrocarboniphaga effusa TaxID=243629 RepID=UPI003137A414